MEENDTMSCSNWDSNWLPSLIVTKQAITGLVTPHARPRACFKETKRIGHILQQWY